MDKTKQIVSIFGKSILTVTNLLLLIGSLAFAIFLVYFFQTKVYQTGTDPQERVMLAPREDIEGSGLGNDALSAYTYIAWMDKFFPSIPFWFPTQGAGVSFSSGYQWLAHYIVVGVHQITNINLQMSLKIVKDASFLLSALGIVLICFCRLEYPKQKPLRLFIALIAVYFYLVSPITRYWTDKWGFFAEGVSYMFVAPALIFLDWFIDLSFNKDSSWKKRLALIFGGLFYALAFHTHFMTGLAITNIFIILLTIKTIIRTLKNGRQTLKITGSVILSVALVVTILFGWRFAQFREYGQEVAKGGSIVNLIQFGPKNTKDIFKFGKIEGNYPTLKPILGVQVFDRTDERFIFQGYSMPPYVWFFVLCGLALGWIRSRKILAFSLLTAWGFFAYSPNESGILGYIVQFINNTTGGAGHMFFGNRPAWAAARILAPITAAYGIFMLIDALLILPDYLLKKTSKIIHLPWKHLFRPIIIVPAMSWIFITTIYSIDYNHKLGPIEIPRIATFDKVYDSKKPHEIYISNHKTDLTNIWASPEAPSSIFSQILPSYWPKFDLNELPFKNFYDDDSFSHIPQKPLYTRMDISGANGTLIMKAPLLSDVSTTQAYVGN